MRHLLAVAPLLVAALVVGVFLLPIIARIVGGL